MAIRILVGDARWVLDALPSRSVRCAITSPPYYGLRDYGAPDQLGQETTPDRYIAALVEIFREVRRILTDDGTLWLNLGDCYANDGKWGGSSGGKHAGALHGQTGIGRGRVVTGAKPKDLLMIPARVALALQADGWTLRSHVVWHKPNVMPESVRDRPTCCHESVFLFSKSAKYFYDAAAVREPFADARQGRDGGTAPRLRNRGGRSDGFTKPSGIDPSTNGGRNLRNVWTISTKPYKGAHFATFPPELAERCIKAGSAPGDTVLDPFFGAGTVGLVADRLNRHCTGIELNPRYADLARTRLALPSLAAPALAAE